MRSKGKLRWDLVLIAALLLLSGILYLALNHGRQEGARWWCVSMGRKWSATPSP